MGKKNLPKIKRVKFDEAKHLPKNLEEKINDEFFILLTTFLGERQGLKVNRLNLQKTLFLTKILLHQEGIKFFNTGFYKYLHGPYQKKLHFATQRLASYTLIEKEDIAGNNIILTNKGINFLLFALQKMKKDEAFRKYTETALICLSKFSGDKAGKSIDFTHSLRVKVGNQTKTIHKLEDSENYYLEPSEKTKVKKIIKAPSEAIANLINFRAYSVST